MQNYTSVIFSSLGAFWLHTHTQMALVPMFSMVFQFHTLHPHLVSKSTTCLESIAKTGRTPVMVAPSVRTFCLAACSQRLPPHPYCRDMSSDARFPKWFDEQERSDCSRCKDCTYTWHWDHGKPFWLSFLLSSVTPCQPSTALRQSIHTQSHEQAHAHKAGVPCRSRIILWSWLSPTEAPEAMAPPLSPWQPGVTGSHPVCWIRESELVRNKRSTWMT